MGEPPVAGPPEGDRSHDGPADAHRYPRREAGLADPEGGNTEDLDGIFISPDDPIPPRSSRDTKGTMVTGIDNDPHLEIGPNARPQAHVPDPALWWEAPGVADLIAILEKLVKDLRQGGLEGVADLHGMNSAERTLRGYCLGYLSAQAEDQ